MEKEKLTLVLDMKKDRSIPLAPPNRATAVAGNHGMSQLMCHAEWTMHKAGSQDGAEMVVDGADFSHHGAIRS